MRASGVALSAGFLGLLIGALAACSPGGGFIAVLAFLAAATLWRSGQARDRRFLVILFLSGFLLRSALSLGLDLIAWRVEGQPPFRLEESIPGTARVVDRSRGLFKLSDSDDYSERGYALAQYAQGKQNPTLMAYLNNRYGRNAYLYAIGGFYRLFGFSPISVKWLNAVLGALLGPLVFFLAWECFRLRWVARCAAALTAFYPSLILWSLSNMKEPLLMLVSLLLLLGLSKLASARRRGAALRWAAACAALIAAHAALRFPAYTTVLVLGWLAAVWVSVRQPAAWRLGVVVALLAAGWVGRPLLHRGLAGAFLCHARYLEDPGMSYRILPDHYYGEEGRARLARGEMETQPGNLLRWTAKALFHYAAEPLPGRVENGFLLAAYPQMILWYFILAFAGLGAWAAVGVRPQGIFLVLVLALWLLIGAITNGNVGTLFRFRDMLTPLALTLGSLGLRLFLWGRAEAAG